ncbi:hypothetical protein YC2023_089306 [Brassica napus]
MASPITITLIFLFLFLLYSAEAKRTYIVRVKHSDKPESFSTHHDWYTSQLQSISTDPQSQSQSESESPLLYTYTTSFNGFSAFLDTDEAESLLRSESILDVFEDPVYTLDTTRTPEFLGLNSEFGVASGYSGHASNGVIIGVLDTGVWPESKSYDDYGMPEIPSKWKGECESGPDFDSKLCNKKLVGARSFSKGFQMSSGGGFSTKRESVSPRDVDGHGTHTSSTAAGSAVTNASFLGYAAGTARGMATGARVATYKVCWSSGCFGSDILAAMDRAILDGVDVLSLSLGGGSAPYYRDTIAIGSFSAMEKGVFVSCSAGNSGPTRSSVANVAPWVMTVGAGTLDRDFPAYANLGNGKRLVGVSLYSGEGMGTKPLELVYNKGNSSSSNLCLPASLDPTTVRGKIVVCDRGVNARVEKGAVVRDAGGLGMIMANTAASGEELVADSHLLPAIAVGKKTGDLLREYIKSDSNPTALLVFKGTVLDVQPSPVVAAFSSRGPNTVTPEILKPDVIGPGVNILAGWSDAIGPTGLDKDSRRTQFNIMSGTSMSCPHISGLAGLLKAAHPEWSPSAIKSALMTTAYNLDNTNSPLRDAADNSLSNPHAHGSGHVDPQKALSPGLVYDISTEEYIRFLCSLDYTVDHIVAIVKRPSVNCSKKFSNPGQLNYPSFSVLFGGKRVVRYTREVTNVGAPNSVYKVVVNGAPSVGISVKPSKLSFRSVGEKKRYTVTFVSKKGVSLTNKAEFGSITWSNPQHQVRSPVAFSWNRF